MQDLTETGNVITLLVDSLMALADRRAILTCLDSPTLINFSLKQFQDGIIK